MIQWIAIFFVLALFLSVGISCASKTQDPHVGLIDNKLRPCPSSPNCVCTEYSGAKSFVSPVPTRDDEQKAWESAIAVVQEMGGEIIKKQDNYLHATFTSRIFRFIDDFEFRLDPTQKVIHLRSASRVGHSDLGVNRKRAEKFKTLFASELDNPDVHTEN